MEVRESRGVRPRLGFFVAVALVCLCGPIATVDASVHDYFSEAFASRSNAFFFHGGSEGLRAPRSAIAPPTANNVTASPKGKSFIRYKFFIFCSGPDSGRSDFGCLRVVALGVCWCRHGKSLNFLDSIRSVLSTKHRKLPTYR